MAGIIRVAIVDEYRLVVDGIAASISPDADIAVVAAESSWSGLLAHPEFPVDVVVVDLNLADGIPIKTKIRTLTAAGCGTVVTTRRTDVPSIRTAIHAGALSFVTKRDPSHELTKAIRAAARGERYFTKLVAGAAAAEPPVTEDPRLGEKELRALTLYASGQTIKEVAASMGTTEETVKSYVKRARRKYRKVGVDLSTKILLRRHGIQEGWINID